LHTGDTQTPKETTPVHQPFTPAQQLLQKDETRTEFMATVGLGVVSILRISSIVHFLTGHQRSGQATATRTGGYGSGPYGG
jgi:hypothetical protein